MPLRAACACAVLRGVVCRLRLLVAGSGIEPASGGDSETGRARAVQAERRDRSAACRRAALPPEAVQQFDQRRRAHERRRCRGRRAGFRASRAYPTYSGPLLNLGILQAKAGKLRGRREDAPRAPSSATATTPRRSISSASCIASSVASRKRTKPTSARVQIDPNYALAYLNLGVLCDLYLQQPRARARGVRALSRAAQPPDAKVNGWVTELKKRLGSEPRSARTRMMLEY